MVYSAEKYGIVPGCDVAEKLNNLLCEMADVEGEKVIEFKPGIYYIYAENCPEEKLYITNTIGKKEYKSTDKKFMHRVMFNIKNTSDLIIKGEGATFVACGRVTNAAVLNSHNIKFDGIEITAKNPDLHEFTVEAVCSDYVDFILDSESRYIRKKKSFFFVGRDFETPFINDIAHWGYFPHFFANDKDSIVRGPHPFSGNKGIEEIADHHFRVYLKNAADYTAGDSFAIYDARRYDVGFFVENSSDITLQNVKQRFNVSLAFVAQNSENLTLDSVKFCPAENQVKQLVSYADFIQVCMCKGLVKVVDSEFASAGDDVANIHGTFLEITSVKGNTVKAKFRHHQSFGYLAFNEGDTVDFVSPEDLLAKGSARVKSAFMQDEYTVVLELDNASEAKKGLCIENATLCPDFYFARNTIKRIVTRGLLITTRGKVLIEDNNFDCLTMPALLFSGDARNWFESGLCKDVTIRNNRFNKCCSYYIQILPENSPKRNAVHGRFLIEGNTFEGSQGIDAQRCDELIFKNNIIKGKTENFVMLTDVTKATIEY